MCQVHRVAQAINTTQQNRFFLVDHQRHIRTPLDFAGNAQRAVNETTQNSGSHEGIA
jgi:hypothetical protein